MSLLKLLSTGKSLVGMKSTASPYRMRSANPLPKFGSPKNPFESLPKTEPLKPVATTPARTEEMFEAKPEPVVAPLPVTTPIAKPTPASTESVLKDFRKPGATQKIKHVPKAEVAAPTPIEEEASAEPAKGNSIAGWVKKLNPLAHLPKREPGDVKEKPARTAPVQGELSLEKVRVMRNELNDSDLEFIASKPVVRQSVSGAILPQAQRPRLTTWGRLTSRMTGAVEAPIPQIQ